MARKQQLGDTLASVVATNKDAGILAASLVAGNVVNGRLAKIVTPKLPLMVRGYAQTDLGEAVIANIFAAGLMHMFPDNTRVLMATDCMIKAAAVKFASTLNIEEMVDELLAGVELPTLAQGE